MSRVAIHRDTQTVQTILRFDGSLTFVRAQIFVAILGLVAFRYSYGQVQTDENPSGAASPNLPAGNGPADAPVATKRNYGEVSAGTANSKASLSFAADYAPAASGFLPAFATLSTTVSAPLGTGSTTTQLATLDGLADSTNITLKVIGFWVQTREPTAEEKAHFCGAIRDAAKNAQNAKRPDKGDLKRCKSSKGLDSKCGSGNRVCCSTDNAELLSCMGLMPKSEADAFSNSFWLSPVTWASGFSTTVGTKSYQFLQPTTLGTTKQTLTPWSAQAFVATQWGESLLTGGFKYQVAYRDATSGSLCPSPTTYPVQCKTGPIGPPSRTESPIPYLEYRRRIGAGFAIDPSVNYDLKKSVVGINLPVYFVGDGKGKLTGGASVGWRSDQSGTQFGLFVGSAFSLSPQ